MIKVAITGADTPVAGELIRILVNHPEIELTTVSAPGHEGRAVSDTHHGLIGESRINFSGPLSNLPDSNVLFICGNSMSAAEFSALRLARPDLRTIILNEIPNLDYDRTGVVYGLPEINRKPLVRGATAAMLPSPLASPILIPLYPLAMNMLLNDSITIEVEAPEDIIAAEKRRAPGEILKALNETQNSFCRMPEITYKVTGHPRGLKARITMSCPVALDHLVEIFEIYDDHNFAFPVLAKVAAEEVAGTDKCIFSLDKPDDSTLVIESVSDPRMRGGAAEAVHIMNLLFGLHEKTGLALKASDF